MPSQIQLLFQALKDQLGEKIITWASSRYLEEPRGRWRGGESILALPRSSKDVCKIVKAASHFSTPIIPYGGGTGLVGGQIKPDGGTAIILSLEHMNKIRAVYPKENVITVEAGCVLNDVQKAVAEHGLLFPLSLASEGSAQIGGNLATNAGGINVLRYGNTRDLCLGLEAVMADGTLWNGLSRLRKDNTGYDLRHLLIGSEGTLGVITAASLRLFANPQSRLTAFLKIASPEAALEILSTLQHQTGESINAFELINKQGFDFLKETLPSIRLPFEDYSEWMILLELGLSEAQRSDHHKRPEQPYGQDLLERTLLPKIEKGYIFDALIAQSEEQRRAFWSVREHIPEANRLIGSISSHDISLPLSKLSTFIKEADAAISKIGTFRINCFGHMGDGNLHYNVFPIQGNSREDHLKERDIIKITLHDLVHSMQGSVSAEHGVGRLKTADLERYGDPVKLKAMRAIKSALDPQGIMNPGAVLRDRC